ncbi:MAG: WD40/YVTN/BNR-like repeat-containing protein [Labedaea sp.]
MPDLDAELETLREDLLDSVRAPELAAVIDRSRQRTTRRRTQIGAVAAVLLVGAAIPVLRTALRPLPDPAAPGTTFSVSPTTPTGPAWAPATGTPFVYNIRWYDHQHGFALRGSCDSGAASTTCTSELLVTEDGERWHPRRLPDSSGTTVTGANWELAVLGQNHLVVQAPTLRYFSEDAGEHWRKVPVEPGQTVAAIPPGALLESRCSVVTSFCRDLGELLVLLPDSGRTATLATSPPLTHLAPGQIPAGDGGWWVSGTDPATGRLMLAVSRDAGRSWTISPVPAFTGTPFSGLTVVGTPQAVYATAAGQLAGVKNGLLVILRSIDGGKTWERTWQAADGAEPRSIAGVPLAATDGRLLVSTETGALYASVDGGKTFAVDRSIGRLGSVEWHSGGYFGNVPGSSNYYWYSPDGVQWARFIVG